MNDTIPVYRPRPRDINEHVQPLVRYTARLFPGPPDPRPWGIWDGVARSYVSGEAYASEREAAFSAALMSRAYVRAMADREES